MLSGGGAGPPNAKAQSPTPAEVHQVWPLGLWSFGSFPCCGCPASAWVGTRRPWGCICSFCHLFQGPGYSACRPQLGLWFWTQRVKVKGWDAHGVGPFALCWVLLWGSGLALLSCGL